MFSQQHFGFLFGHLHFFPMCFLFFWRFFSMFDLSRKIGKKWRWPKRNPKCCWKNLERLKIAKTSRKLGKHRKQIERQNHGVLSTHCFSNFLGWSILFYFFYDFLDFQGLPGIGKHKYMIDHCLNVCILTDRCMMVPNIMNTCNVGPPSYKLVYKHQ